MIYIRKLFIILFPLSFYTSVTNASTEWTLNGYKYTVDTLFHAYIGPGTTQTSLKLGGAVSFRIFYTTTDLTCPNVDVRAIKHTDQLKGTSTISNAIESHSNASRNYFAGANADFFSYTTSAPCGINVVDREIYCSTSSSGWSIFGINDSGIPIIGTGTVAITITTPSGKQFTGDNVNRPLKEGQIAIYTPRFGCATDEQMSVSEVVICPVESPLTPGATVQMRVQGSPIKGNGKTPIPNGSYVLSGTDLAALFIDELTDGDIIKVKCAVRINGITGGRMQQVLGGCPQILSDGNILDTENILDHLATPQPRTAVGFNADRTKLIILVADGRSIISAGTRSKVLAGIMKYVGCNEALNFDGGGSSELFVKGQGIVNVPSDGKERSVTNGIYLSTDSPQDNIITEIRFIDWAKTISINETYTPHFYGYNRYGVLIDTDVQGVILDTPDYSTFKPSSTGSFSLSANYQGCIAKINVTVIEETSIDYITKRDNKVKAYPISVQAGQAIHISANDRTFKSIKLISANGTEIYTPIIYVNNSNATIVTDNLSSGTYIVISDTEFGTFSTTIFIL